MRLAYRARGSLRGTAPTPKRSVEMQGVGADPLRHHRADRAIREVTYRMVSRFSCGAAEMNEAVTETIVGARERAASAAGSSAPCIRTLEPCSESVQISGPYPAMRRQREQRPAQLD